jgi:hypothetical protein
MYDAGKKMCIKSSLPGGGLKMEAKALIMYTLAHLLLEKKVQGVYSIECEY